MTDQGTHFAELCNTDSQVDLVSEDTVIWLTKVPSLQFTVWQSGRSGQWRHCDMTHQSTQFAELCDNQVDLVSEDTVNVIWVMTHWSTQFAELSDNQVDLVSEELDTVIWVMTHQSTKFAELRDNQVDLVSEDTAVDVGCGVLSHSQPPENHTHTHTHTQWYIMFNNQ